jgi:hypothetical protein
MREFAQGFNLFSFFLPDEKERKNKYKQYDFSKT